MGTVVFVSHDRYFIDKLATRCSMATARPRLPGNTKTFWRKQQTTNSAPAAAPHRVQYRNDAIGNGHEVMPSRQHNTKTKRLNPIKRKQMEEPRERLRRHRPRRAAIAICRPPAELRQREQMKQQNLDLEKHREKLAQLMKEWEEVGQR